MASKSSWIYRQLVEGWESSWIFTRWFSERRRLLEVVETEQWSTQTIDRADLLPFLPPQPPILIDPSSIRTIHRHQPLFLYHLTLLVLHRHHEDWFTSHHILRPRSHLHLIRSISLHQLLNELTTILLQTLPRLMPHTHHRQAPFRIVIQYRNHQRCLQQLLQWYDKMGQVASRNLYHLRV